MNDNQHWAFTDLRPQDIAKPPTMEGQMVAEGRDWLQITFGVALYMTLIALACWFVP